MVASGVIAVDLAAATVARRQHGVVTWYQLLAVGMTKGEIRHRLKNARLHTVHRGVYLLGNPSPAPFAQELAAVLACGEEAYLAGWSAPATWGMLPAHEGPPHVAIVGRAVNRKGIVTSQVAPLDPLDTRTFQAIPILAPARAIVEVAGDLTPDQLADAIERGQVKRLITKAALEEALARAPRRPGTGLIRDLLTDLVFTRSKGERKVMTLIRAARLPIPKVNFSVDGDEIDFVWEELQLTLEVDGFRFHATRRAFERDRRRDADRQRAGHTVMRATYNEVDREPHYFIGRLAVAIARAEDRLRRELAPLRA